MSDQGFSTSKYFYAVWHNIVASATNARVPVYVLDIYLRNDTEDLKKFFEDTLPITGLGESDKILNFIGVYQDNKSISDFYVNAEGSTAYLANFDYADRGAEPTVKLITCDKEIFAKVQAKFVEFEMRRQASAVDENIRVILHDQREGVVDRRAPFKTDPIVRDNYDDTELKQFDRLVKHLGETQGLTIVDGPPGTGKTHMVMGLMQARRDVNFWCVPADVATRLAGPEFLSMFLKKGASQHAPVVVVIEDGDGMLVRRASDNMSSISALLNMSDGIFGRLMKIHVVVTTNAPKLDYDPAILRAGRIFEHIHIGPLSEAHAKDVYKRLTGESRAFKGPTTLATVYAEAAKKK